MKQSIPRTMKTVLVETIRDEIVEGSFVPGQHLRLEELADRFDVSTMPVREALRDLEAEGLVRIFPHRGAVVTELSADELQDIYDIRMVLEAMGTRLAVPLLNKNTLTELTSLIEQIDVHEGEVPALVRLNHQFHLTLYTASGRSHLCELNRKLRCRTQHYLHLFTVEAKMDTFSQTQGEHRIILEACERGDAEQAAALMHEHVAKVGRAIVEYVRQRYESAAVTSEKE